MGLGFTLQLEAAISIVVQTQSMEDRTVNRLFPAFVVIALLVMAPQHGIVADGTSTLSGRVVDINGSPVAGFGLRLEPVHIESDEMVDDSEQGEDIKVFESRTDGMGRFFIDGIAPLKHQVSPRRGSDYEIQSMKFGAVTVHQHEPSPFGGIAFAIKPGARIENVEIRVKARNHIRGRIVFADGTPLLNASIGISARHRSPDGAGSGSSSSSGKTDADGYFMYHAEETAFYTITVTYEGLSATAAPFLLREGENKEDLVFTFDSAPIPADATDGRIEVYADASTSSSPGDSAAWVVNPENGHIYKKIHCQSWDDANIQAVAEDAHLVAINDAAEQEWLSKVFGGRPCWIGLTDYAKEGEWAWESGEPVTFTNWAPHEPEDNDWGDEDFVWMGFSGEWSDVGADSVEWQMIRMAIIEKDGVTGMPSDEK